MTEAEWLACEDPSQILNHFGDIISERKLRLFTLACCRCDKSIFQSIRFQRALEIADHFTEGLATNEEIEGEYKLMSGYACSIAGQAPGKTEEETIEWARACAVSKTLKCNAFSVVASMERSSNGDGEGAVQPRLTKILKDIARNPFRPIAFGTPWFDLNKTPRIVFPFFPTSANPAWRTPMVLALANGIYVDRAFDRMPMLADALEEAGCENADFLLHCREPGEHVRGCWVLDLVLGKE